MEDCIFCKIVKGDIPSSKVFEDDKFYAFLDISPVNKGHVLVIPKEHHETLTDLPEGLIKGYLATVKKVAEAVMKGMRADGYNVQMNNYKAAGQVVFHTHVHIVPRYEGDGLELWPGQDYECGEMEDALDRIKEKLT